MFGLSADWLLHRGRPFAARVVLSYVEQLERLRRDCPEAVPTAVVAGDPCFDRLLASLPHRRRYRRVFGLGDGHTMIAVSSTWGRAPLLGRRGELLRSCSPSFRWTSTGSPRSCIPTSGMVTVPGRCVPG